MAVDILGNPIKVGDICVNTVGNNLGVGIVGKFTDVSVKITGKCGIFRRIYDRYIKRENTDYMILNLSAIIENPEIINNFIKNELKNELQN